MPFFDTEIEGLKIFEPRVFEDDRGFFYESYNQNIFKAGGIEATFVQDNRAKSSFGVVRGLHYQCGIFAQAKLVSAPQGEVLDVVVDIRPGSPTFGRSFSIILSESNKKQLFIPRGFAHGYSVLSEEAVFYYKCDNFYNKPSEGGIHCLDQSLNIDWKIPADKALLSEKDKLLPGLGDHIPVW
ncbi:MAG: dTDP-4-dehydrorhamnose 3,5-epimerase [Bacteroidota bacterium]